MSTESQQHGVLGGIHPVETLLKTTPRRVVKLVLSEERQHDKRLRALKDLAEAAGVMVSIRPKKKLDGLFDEDFPHQGVVALVSAKPTWDVYQLLDFLQDAQPESPLILALDQVTDPHNVGAMIRTGAAVGVTAILAPKQGSVMMSPALHKASAGLVDHVQLVLVTNLVDAMDRLKSAGFWWVGASLAPGSIPYTQYNFKGATGIVVGSEGKGLRRLVAEHCDQLVTIPMADGVESLNVSVSAGVLLYEAVRQRQVNTTNAT